MQLVHTAQSLIMISHLKNVLDLQGIECQIRNQHLASALGQIPPIECWPEIWVLDDTRAEEARRIITKALYFTGPTGRAWHCPGCGEKIEGQFTHCWNCGQGRP